MSDQGPNDENLGRALGRAVESQSVRETPFTQSRLARRLDRPAGRGWLGTLAVAAALGLFVAVGAFFATRGPVGVADPEPTASPVASPAATPGRGTPAAASATPAPALVSSRVYFARDGLPPIGAAVQVAAGTDRTPEQRIGSRIGALITAVAQPPSGAMNIVDPRRLQSVDSVRVVDGDTALIDVIVNAGDWGVRGAAQTQALLQQLVYTATEEPGIRRVLLTENGGKRPTIDQVVVDKPLAREDVHGYVAQPPERIATAGNGIPLRASVTHSVDAVAPGLARVVVALTPSTGQFGPLGYLPRMSAEVRTNDERAQPTRGKQTLVVEIDGIEGPASSTTVDRTPLRAIHFTPGTNAARTAVYELALDDIRPWRVAILKEPARVVIDVGGHPMATALNMVVYSPLRGGTVTRDVAVTGMARAFEATVSWRLRDSGGREVAKGFTTASEGSSAVWGTYEFRAPVPASVSGNVTLEVYEASARDGSDTNKVAIPLQVR